MLTPLLLSSLTAPALAQEAPAKVAATALIADASAHVFGTKCAKATQMIGCRIVDAKGKRLGDVRDLVLDIANQRISYLVVAADGQLGIGDKYLAIPWRLLTLGKNSADGKAQSAVALDAASLKSAPAFEPSKWPDLTEPAWSDRLEDHYRAGREAMPPLGSNGNGPGARGTNGMDHLPPSPAVEYRRLAFLIGMAVVDRSHHRLADVEDLLVDTRAATIEGLLLAFGGELGVGERFALLPADALALDPQRNLLLFPGTKARLEAMALPDGKLPELGNTAWLTHGREQCLAAREADGLESWLTAAKAGNVGALPFVDTYDLGRVETVTGTIATIGSVRVGTDAEPHVRLRIRSATGREMLVYAAPASCLAQSALGLAVGAAIEVRGARAVHGSQTVLVAATIVAKGKTATLRDAKGLAIR